MATKFNPNTEVVSETETATKRVSYMTIASDLNTEGKLASNPADFDGSKHLKPSRDDFANPADFYEFKASQNEARAAALMASATKYREEAANIRKFGDPAKRKMAKRAARLRDQLAALEAQLAEEGIDA